VYNQIAIDNCHPYDGRPCPCPILIKIPKVLLTGWWTSDIYLFTTRQVDGHPHPDRWCAALLNSAGFCQIPLDSTGMELEWNWNPLELDRIPVDSTGFQQIPAEFKHSCRNSTGIQSFFSLYKVIF